MISRKAHLLELEAIPAQRKEALHARIYGLLLPEHVEAAFGYEHEFMSAVPCVSPPFAPFFLVSWVKHIAVANQIHTIYLLLALSVPAPIYYLLTAPKIVFSLVRASQLRALLFSWLTGHAVFPARIIYQRNQCLPVHYIYIIGILNITITQ